MIKSARQYHRSLVLAICIMLCSLGICSNAVGAMEEINVVWRVNCPKGQWVTNSVPPGWKIVRVDYFDPGLDQDSSKSELSIAPGWYLAANHPTASFAPVGDTQGWTTISMRHNYFTDGATMEVRYTIRNMTAKEISVWDASESKSAATLAKEARDKANAALTEINNVKNTVTNIQASVGPIIQKVATVNAATCTQGTSIPVIVQASGATEFRARADTGSWTAWTPVGSSVTVTGITGTGAHVIFVEARNASGMMATGQLTVFKL